MKKRLIVVLLTFIITIPLVMVFARADTTQTSSNTITSYGNYTFKQGTSSTTFDFELPLGGNGSFPINLTFNSGSWMSIDYQFKDKYSGTIKFSVTSSADWVLQSSPVYWYASTDGVESTCYISATTTMSSVSRVKTFSVVFTNATAIHFGVVNNGSVTFFNSSQSITISNASFTSQHDLTDIYNDIHQLRTWWDLYIPGMSTYLSNIANNTSTMVSDIALLKSYLDGLEGYTDQIEPYLNELININKIRSYPIWQQNVLFWANKMGTLKFDKQVPYFYYDSSLNTNAPSNPKRIKIDPNKTVSLIFYCDVNVTNSNYHIYGSQVSNVTITRTISSIVPTYPLYLIRLDFTSSHTASVFISIEFDNSFNLYPLFLGDSTLIPDDVHLLFGDDYDNTYTRLLQTIANGVGGTSYDTSEYEQYDQVVDNLNDSLLVDVNNSKNDILTDISNQGGTSNDLHLNNVRIAINGLFNDIFTIFPPLKYLVVVGLILLVLGVIL